MKKVILIVLLLGVAASLAGCVRNPATGKRQIVLVTESQEIAMGQRSDPRVREEYGIVDGPALQNYVQAISKSSMDIIAR